ncbi:nuclear pore complex protein Nup133 [Octopus sinensis]|uniref:Nuclear pore complex protein Nup133 n=1 Tax=Octopus sinensis TaxID=2607531 RepID=A0A6P7SRD1_9MOLL|nr:nuclear pore complex protein Nup133 [Octopus sinensis]
MFPRRKLQTSSASETIFSPKLGGYRTPTRAHNISYSSLNSYSFVASGSVEKLHTLQTYGNPMPVLVSEALNIAEKITEYTVKIDPSGWAWLVGGRKLFIWRYNQSSYEKSSRIVKELTLPPSDLAHDANRVCVICNPNESQQAACIAVSPEGVVRYWSSIAHETAFIEINAELKGEECACVVNLQPHGCILATTTSSFVLLSPTPEQNSISYRIIRASQGMLAGITSRMTSFIFGSSSAQASGAALHALIADDDYELGKDRFFYVLSGNVLQKWSMAANNTETLLFQSNVERLFRIQLAKKIWNQDVTRLPQLNIWLLDLQLTSFGVVILAAAMNPEVRNVVHYAVGSLCLQETSEPMELESLTVLEHVEMWQESNEDHILGYHLLVSNVEGDHALIYSKTQAHCISLDQNFPSETVDFNRPGDQILGVGRYDCNPLLFSAHRGILLVSKLSNQQNFGVDSEPVFEIEESTTGDNSLQSIFTAAFVAYCHKKIKKTEELLTRAFPSYMNQEFEMETNETKVLPVKTSELDTIIAQTSLSIVDDYPSSDPRWAESSKGSVQDFGYKSSNLILKQLEKKLNLHELFNKFLRHFNLTDKLNSIPVRDVMMDTTMFLCENGEKLAAMIALRSSEQDYKFLDEISLLATLIKRVIDRKGETHHSINLTHFDLFYREVSSVHDIFNECLEYEHDHLTADMDPKHIVNLVITINDLILYVLQQTLRYRSNKQDYYRRFVDIIIETEYIPWTCSVNRQGMRALLKKQCSMTMEQGIVNAQDHHYQTTLFNQLTDLADILLDGYTSQLISLEKYDKTSSRYTQLCKMYEEDRALLTSMLMNHQEYAKAASLAEKYYDFNTLAKVCDITDDTERLEKYCMLFVHKGFRESMYNYYLNMGKRGKLLTMPMTVELSLVLSKCKSISWLMDIETQDYFSAYETLINLAMEEKKFVARKKTLLSMAKLCLLCTDNADPNLISEINAEQALITHQELIPQEVFQSTCIDPNNMRVLLPHEMIQLYIHEDNLQATEYHFKMALDLISFVKQKEADIDCQALFYHIWAQSILRNNWARRSDDPLEDCTSKLFYKIISLIIKQNGDIKELLPDKTHLIASEELLHLQQDDNFLFLLETIYEQVYHIV